MLLLFISDHKCTMIYYGSLQLLDLAMDFHASKGLVQGATDGSPVFRKLRPARSETSEMSETGTPGTSAMVMANGRFSWSI